MSILITGVAGFIGCNLAESFVGGGHTVFGVDNLCRGSLANLKSVIDAPRFSFAQVDLADLDRYREIVMGFHIREPITEVWHMAANSDIPGGSEDVMVDLRDTFMTTFNTLQLMKSLNVGVLVFASSSAIYGDKGETILSEDCGPLLPISNYGAMKLSSEAIISAAAESHLSRVYIFRFPNVVGLPATHGVILDFIRKLKKTPDHLIVLGDGTQKKEYLHVDELADAMLYIRERAQAKMNVFNIGSGDEGVTVRFIAEQTVRVAAPAASITYGEGGRGWVGDVPRFSYSIEKLRRLGWSPRLNSAAAVQRAIREIFAREQASKTE